jgi:cytochrome bd ubiquinol oxidase subunit II
MILDYETLKFIWWILIGTLLIGFAVTDGMDLGVANLLPLMGKTDKERDVMVATIKPHWDGNQVWLITAGGALFAAWPMVYAAAFSGLYMGMLLVLYSLFFRPIGLDYRSKIKDPRWGKTWDWCIFISGAVPSVIFGVVFGNLLQGLPFHLDDMYRSHYEGSFIFALLPLLNPFALLCGVISFLMLSVHGALWMQIRADVLIKERSRKVALVMLPVIILLFVIGGYWVLHGLEGYRIISMPETNSFPDPLAKEVVRAKGAWFDIYDKQPLAMIAPLAAIGCAVLAWIGSYFRKGGAAFILSGLSITGIIATAGLAMFPFVMPSSTDPKSSLTLWDSTSSLMTLTVMFWVVAIILPIVLLYTIWCYVRMWEEVTLEDVQDTRHSTY